MKQPTILMILTIIMAMSIKPAVAKPKPHKHVSTQHQRAKTLQQYIGKLCNHNCVEAKHLNRTVRLASQKHKVPRNLILAVLKVESRFKRTAFKDGNYGLMQVNYTSHKKEIRSANLFNVETNIDIGSSILSKCLEDNRNNITKTLECYKGNDSREYKQEVKKALLTIASLTP